VTDGAARAFPLAGGTMDYAAPDPVRAVEQQGSIFVWIKVGADAGTIAARADPGTGAYDFWLWLGAGGQVALYANYPDWQGAYSGPALPAVTWALLGVTWDEKTVAFYVDGKETGTAPADPAGLPRRRSSRFQVGADPSGEKVEPAGLIGSVMVYNRPLPAQEVSILHLGTRARFR